MWGLVRRWRRKRLEDVPFPSEWLALLRNRVPYYALLSAPEQNRLQRLIVTFIAEVRFEGCAGLDITDEMRVTIAAQACLLLVTREQDFYPGLQSVLVYPSSYLARSRSVDPLGVVHEGDERRLGEAWMGGAVVLSWDDVQHDATDFHDGRNVTLHEFAHQLDQQDGSFDGAPVLDHPSRYRAWARVLTKEYEALQDAAEQGEASVIDQYGATDPAEFFAVVTEAFFEQSEALKIKHPQLYRQLKRFFRQDPAARFEAARRP